MMKSENAVVVKFTFRRDEAVAALLRESELRKQGKIRCGCVGGCGIENCPGADAGPATAPEGGI